MWAVKVTGLPAPKGSMKCIGKRGKVRHALIEDAGPSQREWRARVQLAGEHLLPGIGETLDGPVSVEVTFTLPRPASARGRVWPHLKANGKTAGGDLDKLVRLILDAFTDARVWTDDSRVVEITARKAYPDTPAPDLVASGGALIRIWRTET